MVDDPLSAQALMAHIRALADQIGPRRTGSLQEAAAREYIRRTLSGAGVAEIEEQAFPTVDSIFKAYIPLMAGPLLAAPLSWKRWGSLIGGAVTLGCTYLMWRHMSGGQQPLAALMPRTHSANQIVRIPPRGERRRTVVLVGHTDSQHALAIARPPLKYRLVPNNTIALGLLTATGIAQFILAARSSWLARGVQVLGLLALGQTLATIVPEMSKPHVDGANDNATAVACLLGLGAQLQREPLEHTEVWLAFTGAEEVMCVGMHALLDRYGEALRDAWFIDFEMVGTPQVVYITRHSGLSYANAYTPDPESLALAERVAAARPDLGVRGAPMVIVEEVGTLRGRGFRGICLSATGEDGWLKNWHLLSDTSEHIDPDGVERAARFALAMLEDLDRA
jgi:hypothetical protein